MVHGFTARLGEFALQRESLAGRAYFRRNLFGTDEHTSLAAMAGIPVTLLVGDADRLTPVGHSQRRPSCSPMRSWSSCRVPGIA